jgi:uncharacterized membrane protein YcaP (DUF421 family)
MSDLFALSMPWWEFVLRAVVVYVVVLLMVRFSKKRTIGQFTPFDLIVVVLLGNAVQNSLVGADHSLVGGLLLAAVLVTLNWVAGYITSRSRRADRLIEGTPVLLLRDGQVFRHALRDQHLSEDDLDEAIRQEGCEGPQRVALAVLETNGRISVIPRAD